MSDGAYDPGEIEFVDLELGMGQAVGEFAVVGEQERARDVHVEASDWKYPGVYAGDQIEDGLALVRVFDAGDDALGLVEYDVDVAFVGEDDATEFYRVGGGVDAAAEFGDGAIYGDAAFGDEPLAFSARGYAAGGEKFL